MSSSKNRFTARNILITTAAIGLVSLAVNQQLQLPPMSGRGKGAFSDCPTTFVFLPLSVSTIPYGTRIIHSSWYLMHLEWAGP